MTYTPPTSGAANWDVPLNAALEDIHDTALAAQADADDSLAGGGAAVATQQDTTSTTYTDLTTVGPSVAVTLNEARTAIVLMKADMLDATTADDVWCSFAVSGATTLAASDARAVRHNGSGGVQSYAAFETVALNAGANTITMKYRVDGTGTGRFSNRNLAVIVT